MIHTSIGLLAGPVRCHFHHCALVPKKQRIKCHNFGASRSHKGRYQYRTILRCTVLGCHYCDIQEAEHLQWKREIWGT